MADAAPPAGSGGPGRRSKDRSPSFPFIPLQTAIERLTAFEKHFGRHPTPADKAGLAWGMKAKSSQADQTLAALRSFGLVRYDGMGADRQVILTEEGRTYLRAQQDSVKQQVLKQCALRPKIIRKFWATWGADRPVEAVALDELVLKNGFSDAGAENFLRVYDATVTYAGLTNSDTVPLEIDDPEEITEEERRKPPGGGIPRYRPPPPAPPPPPPADPKGKVILMEGERELTSGLLSKGASFRLIVTGAIGEKEIERLIKKLELDKEILAEAEPASDDEGRE